MTINLSRLNLDSLVKTHLNPDNVFNIAPNKNNEVYTFDKILIHYKKINNLKGIRSNLLQCPVKLSKLLHFYKDSQGKEGTLNFWSCEIPNYLPNDISSAFFYHGFAEIWILSKGFSKRQAHYFAVEETKNYIERCFLLPELVSFERWNKKLIDECPHGLFVNH